MSFCLHFTHTNTHTNIQGSMRDDSLHMLFPSALHILIHNTLQLRPSTSPLSLSIPLLPTSPSARPFPALMLFSHRPPSTPVSHVIAHLLLFIFSVCRIIRSQQLFIHRSALMGFSRNGRTDSGQPENEDWCGK